MVPQTAPELPRPLSPAFACYVHMSCTTNPISDLRAASRMLEASRMEPASGIPPPSSSGPPSPFPASRQQDATTSARMLSTRPRPSLACDLWSVVTYRHPTSVATEAIKIGTLPHSPSPHTTPRRTFHPVAPPSLPPPLVETAQSVWTGHTPLRQLPRGHVHVSAPTRAIRIRGVVNISSARTLVPLPCAIMSALALKVLVTLQVPILLKTVVLVPRTRPQPSTLVTAAQSDLTITLNL
ncbi:hypothetical protein B0H19DRAFT_1259003 [Mycena capillaripes]|nr:hypothetical protein B0H19DRAFT_1259003 [Mycena capillaripes]